MRPRASASAAVALACSALFALALPVERKLRSSRSSRLVRGQAPGSGEKVQESGELATSTDIKQRPMAYGMKSRKQHKDIKWMTYRNCGISLSCL